MDGGSGALETGPVIISLPIRNARAIIPRRPTPNRRGSGIYSRRLCLVAEHGNRVHVVVAPNPVVLEWKEPRPPVSDPTRMDLKSPQAFFSRELSWLSFARRVLSMAEREELPLIERVRFAGIVGMLHDEFFMKRISGLKRQISKGTKKLSLDGRTPEQEFIVCRDELQEQAAALEAALVDGLLPALAVEGHPVLDYDQLTERQRLYVREHFKDAVAPILTPLAVDAEHPFPFISHGGLNLAVLLPNGTPERQRFLRIKVPDNRRRWVALPDGGFVPLEQVIANNLDSMFPDAPPAAVHFFRVTRGASGESIASTLANTSGSGDPEPGSLVRMVSNELKARRFAGVVRLEADREMPKKLLRWLARQLKVGRDDIYRPGRLLALADLAKLDIPGRADLRFPPHQPATHPRLSDLEDSGRDIFDEIRRGDILLHHPYHNFEDSVLQMIQSAAKDPQVLAIKLTIYRTGGDSPIIKALAEAARSGKQVAVLVEITARFDELPNIEWGRFLENEGVHVAYGVERLKTHVKMALVIREEADGVRRYAHIGTGNYNRSTAKLYEDLGLLTCNDDLCADVGTVFNALTGATLHRQYRKLIVAPHFMRDRFRELIRREAEHAKAGRPSGIRAKMNQLQDPEIIRELYRASRAGVPITLNVRGLCCLRPGVRGLSETIRVYGVVGRFLEHSRIYHFVNGGDDAYFIGSADWMKRNLDRRVETVTPVEDPAVRRELARVLEVYETDNGSVWDCDAEGDYTRRQPKGGATRRAAQDVFVREHAAAHGDDDSDGDDTGGMSDRASLAAGA